MARNKLILNRYQPLEQAGKGRFGQVISAFDTHLKRPVAIKLIRLDEETAHRLARSLGMEEPEALEAADPSGAFPADPAFLDSRNDLPPNVFDADARTIAEAEAQSTSPAEEISKLPGLGEAQVAGSLGSPNIVSVYDIQLEGETAYLIMEYVDGVSLAGFLDEFDDELTLDIIAAVVNGIANALKVAHKNHVLHLDIKPANILIGKDGVVKVTDFGMAALPGPDGNTHGDGGTIGYMPPEQLAREPLDERCDEWALASVAYLMLAGNNPFVASSLESAQEAIKNAELIVPSIMWEDLDEDADDVLFSALHPNREGRFKSIKEFASAFVPLLGKPKRGEKQIAQLMVPDEEIDDADETGEYAAEGEGAAEPRVPLRDRMSPRACNILTRVFAALMTAGIGALAALNILASSFFQTGGAATAASAVGGSGAGGVVTTVVWIIVAALAVVAAVLPRFAPLVAYAFLGLALMLNLEFLPGIVLIVLTVAWWAFAVKPRAASGAGASGWRGGPTCTASIGLLTPLAGCVSLGAAPSLVAGCFLSPGKAAATAAHSFVVALVLASFGAQTLFGWDPVRWAIVAHSGAVTTGFLTLLQQPGIWACGISWVLAATAFSALRSTRRNWLGIVGAVVAGAIVIAAPIASSWLSAGGTAVATLEPWLLASVIISAIVGVVLAALFPNNVEAGGFEG